MNEVMKATSLKQRETFPLKKTFFTSKSSDNQRVYSLANVRK